MLFPEEHAPHLKKWIVKRLENTSVRTPPVPPVPPVKVRLAVAAAAAVLMLTGLLPLQV